MSRGTSACALCPTAISSTRSATGARPVVTDHIDTLTEAGLALASGSELEADLIVTATGLKMVPFGAIHLRVDGSDVDL